MGVTISDSDTLSSVTRQKCMFGPRRASRGHCTVTVALVASPPNESLENNNRLYVPGAAGIVNVTDALAKPAGGRVFVPFKYVHWR